MRQVSLFVQMAAIVVVAYMALMMVNRRIADQQREQQRHQPDGFAEFERAYGGTEVKIVQFYSREGTLFEGSSTVLCYGLANARSVRIEPPVEGDREEGPASPAATDGRSPRQLTAAGCLISFSKGV